MALKIFIDGYQVLFIIIFAFKFLFQVFDESFGNFFVSFYNKAVDRSFIILVDVQFYDGKPFFCPLYLDLILLKEYPSSI
jgi:hypothetical protein